VLDDYDFTQVKNSPFGIGTHFAQWYSTEIIPLIVRAGIREIRDEVLWSDLERSKGAFSFPEKYETYLKEVTKANLTAHLGLTYGNGFYDGGKAPYDEAGFSAFGRYAAELVQHFNQVHTVEVWNEWNSPGFCSGPAGSKPDVYQGLIDHAFDAIKKARPDVRVVGCSTTGLWWGGYHWLEQYFKQKDSLRPMDVLSVHPYNCALAPEYLTESMATIRRMAKDNGHDAPPLWVTEVGWPVNVGSHAAADQVYESKSENVSDETQAIYLVRTYILLLAAGVERIHWYDFMNDGVDPKSGECNFGLIHNPEDTRGKYTPKPAYATYAAMTRQLTDAAFSKAEQDSAALRSYVFRKENQDVRAVWTLQPGAILVRADAAFTMTDDMGNRCEIVPAGGESLIALPVGLPIYISGPVGSVSQGLHVTVSERVRVALGEKIEVPYEIENHSANATTVLMQIDGADIRVEVKGRSNLKGVAQLPAAEHEGLSSHTCRIQFQDMTLDVQTINVITENALSITETPQFIDAGTLQLSVENISREKAYNVTGIDWESGELKGQADCRDVLAPSSAGSLNLREIKRPSQAISPLKLTLRLDGQEPFIYQGMIRGEKN